MVIDEGVLFRTNETAFVQTKRKLLDDCDLRCIVSLPPGTFINAGAGVKANLLFFTKGEHSERTRYYDLSDFTNRRHSEGRRFPGPRNPLLRRTKADSSVSLPRPEFTLSPRPPIGGSIVTRKLSRRDASTQNQQVTRQVSGEPLVAAATAQGCSQRKGERARNDDGPVVKELSVTRRSRKNRIND